MTFPPTATTLLSQALGDKAGLARMGCAEGQSEAARVRAIPADVRLVEHGREFVIDDGNFRERGRAGY